MDNKAGVVVAVDGYNQTASNTSSRDATNSAAKQELLLFSDNYWLMKNLIACWSAINFDRGFVHSELRKATNSDDANEV